MFIEYADSLLQFVSAADTEADMIESHTVLVERIPADRPAWICGWTNRQERAAVAKNYPWPELPCYLKSKDARVELTGPAYVGYRESYVGSSTCGCE